MTVFEDVDEAPDYYPQPNIPLMRKVLAHIDAEPDSWEQGGWGVRWSSTSGTNFIDMSERKTVDDMSCGTAFCFAGHTALIEGWQPLRWEESGDASLAWINDDGEQQMIEYIALDALGLTAGEAELLFSGAQHPRGSRTHLRVHRGAGGREVVIRAVNIARGIVIGAVGVFALVTSVGSAAGSLDCPSCPTAEVKSANKVTVYWMPETYASVAMFCLGDLRFAITQQTVQTGSDLERVPEQDEMCRKVP